MSLPSAALAAARLLPTEPAAFLCRLLILGYLCLRSDYRSEIRRNYRLVFSRDRPGFWVRNAWRVGRNLALMTRLGTGRGDEIVDSTHVHGDNVIQSRLVQELHSVMASFHYGVWELLPQAFVRQGLPVQLAVGQQRDTRLQARVERLRLRPGVRLVRSLRDVAKACANPGVTGFMLDNTSQGRQVWVLIGGIELRLPELAFSAARRSGSGVVPAFARMDRDRLRVDVAPSGDAHSAARALLAQVRAHPEEWVWWGKAGAVREVRGEK